MKALAVLFFLLAPLQVDGELETRTWQHGNSQIIGRFLALESGSVSVIDNDGETTTVELSDLSFEDQAYVMRATGWGGSGKTSQVSIESWPTSLK